MTDLNVQYGAGWCAAPGWINFDASPSVWLERLPIVGRILKINKDRFPEDVRFGDIVQGLPIADASAKAVYASHVLEHLCYDDFRDALRNTYRILQPNGVFRLIVPDLAVRAKRYIEAFDQKDPQAALRFMDETILGHRSRPKALHRRIRAMLGNSQHLWMWDEPAMRDALSRSGFCDIRICQLGDAADPAFEAVEAEDRFVDPDFNQPELAMEARRPMLDGT